jgi:hypothetical protein
VSFKKGFEKKAGIIGGAAKLVGKGLRMGGRVASRLAGGPISAALTGLGAASDYSDISQKMRQAAQR